MYFPTTHWSLLARATSSGDDEARRALDELCRRYWTPVNQFVQFRGHRGAEAEDLTQEFFLHVCQHSTFARVDRMRGRFRSFLLGALARFLGDDRDRRNAGKRGGGQTHMSLDDSSHPTAEAEAAVPPQETVAFDRAWARAIFRSALTQVRADFTREERAEDFALLKQFLPGSGEPPSYKEAAQRMGITVAALTSEIHRLRDAFRERVRAEVSATVSAPHEIDEEMAHLHRVLADRATAFPSENER